MTFERDPESKIPNETKKQGSLTRSITQDFPMFLLYCMNVWRRLRVNSMRHDILYDWLIQSGDWKLSPVIAFSEVIKIPSVLLCWHCGSHSGRWQILSASHEGWVWSAVSGADHSGRSHPLKSILLMSNLF